jgi:hypothetical protein
MKEATVRLEVTYAGERFVIERTLTPVWEDSDEQLADQVQGIADAMIRVLDPPKPLAVASMPECCCLKTHEGGTVYVNGCEAHGYLA